MRNEKKKQRKVCNETIPVKTSPLNDSPQFIRITHTSSHLHSAAGLGGDFDFPREHPTGDDHSVEAPQGVAGGGGVELHVDAGELELFFEVPVGVVTVVGGWGWQLWVSGGGSGG